MRQLQLEPAPDPDPLQPISFGQIICVGTEESIASLKLKTQADHIGLPCVSFSLKTTDSPYKSQKEPQQAILHALRQTVEAHPGTTLLLDAIACSPTKEGTPLPQGEDAIEAALSDSSSRLLLAQTLAPLRQKIAWLTCTQMGPQTFVPDQTSTTPDASLLRGGAAAGFAKALFREWACWGRVVDVPTDAAPSNWLHTELLDLANHPEIILSHNQRWLPTLSNPTPTPPLQLPTHPVFVISGGGQGVTHATALALAKELPYRALILGRTTLPETPIPLDDPKAARALVKAQLGEQATPRELQQAVQREKKRALLKQSLQQLEQAGVELLYVPTDLQDGASVKAAIQQAIKCWGQIDAVIHGAGIDISREIDKKTTDELHGVMSVKLKGLHNLHAALHKQPIQRWFALGSVSARFGNAGQVDYAAANEAMARWLCGSSSFTAPLVIDYTAWDEIGMAASLSSLMKERGVDALPPDIATTCTAQLLTQHARGEWVLSGRLLSDVQEPFLDTQRTLHIPNEELLRHTHLHAAQHRFLADHSMDSTEIMPGVVTLSWLQQLARELAPGQALRLIRNVSFHKALKIFPNHSTDVQCHVTRIPSPPSTTPHNALSPSMQDQPPHTLVAQLRSSRQRKGKREDSHHANASFCQNLPPSLPTTLAPLLQLDPSTLTPIENTKQIYNIFFHGPCWQVLDTSHANPNFALSHSPPLQTPLGDSLPKSFRNQAIGLELIFQTAGIWAHDQHQTFLLPHGIGTCALLQSPQPNTRVQARVQFVRRQGDVFYFQALLLDENNNPLQYLLDLSMNRLPL